MRVAMGFGVGIEGWRLSAARTLGGLELFSTAAQAAPLAPGLDPMDTTVGKRRLEILDVKEPCTEDWGAMSGDDRSRHCAVCEQSVYDLSEMKEEDVVQLLSRPGRVCVRFFRRADGRVTTKDCLPFRVRAARAVARGTLRGAARLASATLALLVLLGFGSLAGLDPLGWVDRNLLGRTMGEPPAIAGAVPVYEPPEEVMGEMEMPVVHLPEETDRSESPTSEEPPIEE